MITIYETAFFGPTDNRGQRIKVTNKRTGKSRWHHWDYSVNWGLDQHKQAVWQCADGIIGGRSTVQIGGETKRGYLIVVANRGE